MQQAQPSAPLPEPRPAVTVPRPVVPGDVMQAVFATSSALVLVVDAGGFPILVNPALEQATGWTLEQLGARPFWESLVAPEDADGARDHLTRAIAEGRAHRQEGDWLDRWGGRRRVSMQNDVIPGTDDRPVAVVTVGMDVTEQRRAEVALRERAATDALTGLRNRSALFESLAAALSRAGSAGCGLLFADLDGFKGANDRHGHHVGDLVLVEVAARLRRITGVGDIVARLGGDEFVILCPGRDPHRVAMLADRVEAELAEPIAIPRGEVRIGVSVGTALGRAGQHPDEVVRDADRRMYRAKAAHAARRAALERAAADAPTPLRGARFPRTPAAAP